MIETPALHPVRDQFKLGIAQLHSFGNRRQVFAVLFLQLVIAEAISAVVPQTLVCLAVPAFHQCTARNFDV